MGREVNSCESLAANLAMICRECICVKRSSQSIAPTGGAASAIFQEDQKILLM